MDSTGASEVYQRRATVITRHAEVPQVVQQIGVVRVTEERLRIRPKRLRVEIRQNGDLVRASDDGHQGLDVRVGKGGVHVSSTFFRACAHLTRRWILNRHEAESLSQYVQT